MPGQIEKAKAKAALICGVIAGLLGVPLIIIGCMWIGYGGKDGNGMWSGFPLLLQCVLGIVAFVKLNKVAMVFYLVLAILNTILCIVQAAIAAIAWLIWAIVKAVINSKCSTINGVCSCGKDKVPINLDDCDTIATIEALFICMLIIAGIATIICFASSIIGCMATCCASQPAQTNVVIVQQPGTVGVTHAQQPDNMSYPMS